MVKDPGAKLDYQIDWSQWLDGDQIVASTWSINNGLTVESSNHNGQVTTVWLSGGVPGIAVVINEITTQLGRIDRRSIRVMIASK